MIYSNPIKEAELKVDNVNKILKRIILIIFALYLLFVGFVSLQKRTLEWKAPEASMVELPLSSYK